MADLLQRVFMIFVRPFYVDSLGRKVFHTSTIYAQSSEYSNQYIQLKTTNDTGSTNSPTKLNSKGVYQKDPWFLHSTYTSYEEMRSALKDVIAIYGTDNVKCAGYIPIDYNILPNQ